jgi:integrase
VTGSLPDTRSTRLRGLTYRMVFAVLYGLGLRVGEVARLRIGDIDRDRRLLVVRETKFGKSRLVPFGPVMGERLEHYLARRREGGGGSTDQDALFSVQANNQLGRSTIGRAFRDLLPLLNLDIPDGHALPRVHDLRHSFAVGTLLRWYREGLDPAQRLLHLSTFLGHVNPESTAIYLTITDALLQEAGARFERYARGDEESS